MFGRLAALVVRVPVLRAIPRAKRAAVRSVMRPCSFEDGEVLFRQGDEGQALFVILEGCVRISQRGRRLGGGAASPSPSPPPLSPGGGGGGGSPRKAMSSPGGGRYEEIVRAHLHYLDFFGEVALLQKCTRTASAIAEGPVKCVTLHRQHFDAISSVATEVLERSAQRRNDGDAVAGTAGGSSATGAALTAEEKSAAFDRHQKAVAEQHEQEKEVLQHESGTRKAFRQGALYPDSAKIKNQICCSSCQTTSSTSMKRTARTPSFSSSCQTTSGTSRKRKRRLMRCVVSSVSFCLLVHNYLPSPTHRKESAVSVNPMAFKRE